MPAEEQISRLILVGVNNSPEARAAAAYAAQLAANTPSSTLLLAHAYWTTSGALDVAGRGMIGELEKTARGLVDSLADDLRNTGSAPVETRVAAAKPVAYLSSLATTASTVVLGQDTATLFDRMTFVAVAGHLAATAPCPGRDRARVVASLVDP